MPVRRPPRRALSFYGYTPVPSPDVSNVSAGAKAQYPPRSRYSLTTRPRADIPSILSSPAILLAKPGLGHPWQATRPIEKMTTSSRTVLKSVMAMEVAVVS